MLTDRQINGLIGFLLFIAGAILYANSLNVPFIFDDADNIKNPNLQIESLEVEELKAAISSGTLRSRPVSNFSFAMNYYVGGYKVQGYHVVNAVIHILTAIFLFHLINHTLSFKVNDSYRNKTAVAFFASLFWLAHPLATQSVTYIVQRMNSMAAMFFVLSLLFYVIARKKQQSDSNETNSIEIFLYYTCFAVSGALAIGSKEIAATLPFVVVLYEWFFIQDMSFTWLKKKIPWLIGVAVIFFVIVYFYTDGHIVKRIFLSGSRRDFTTWERVLTQFRVVVHYIGLIVYPHPSRLIFDYNFPFSTSIVNPISTLISFFALGTMLTAGIVLSVKERFISFCILWFFINLAIESSIIGLELIFEHRTYMPSMFVVALLPALLFRWQAVPRVVAALLLSVVVSLCGYWTVARNTVWQDEVSFWEDSVKKSPGKPRSLNNLGVALSMVEKYEEAEYYFRKTISIKKNFPEPYNNLGLLYTVNGRPEDAVRSYTKAIELRPHFDRAHLNLASLYEHQGDYDLALKHFSYLLSKYPESALLNYHAGKMLLRSNNYKEAISFLDKADLKEPQDTSLQLYRGEAYFRSGNVDEAISAYMKAIELNPDNIIANYNLGLLFTSKGEDAKALYHYNRAALRQSVNVPVQYNLGNVYLRLGKLDEARESYVKLLEFSDILANTYNNIGLIDVRQNRLERAAENFRSALRIQPEHPLARSNLKKTEKDE